MGFIFCPECNAKISNKAFHCPHCGFVCEDRNLPISLQQVYSPIPKFKYEITEWKPLSNKYISLESFEVNKNLVSFFGNWPIIKEILPPIAEIIESRAKKDKVLVAQIPQYVKDLIANGEYRFLIDKNGEILPTIRNSLGIVKQVRLEQRTLKAPELSRSLNNLSILAMMSIMLSEIECLGNSIMNVRIEMQNDRLALTDSAMQSLQQAFLIEDSSLRNIAILNCIHKATQSKCVLIRNFKKNYLTLKEAQKKGVFEGIFKKDDSAIAANDAMNDLISITNSVRIECSGYGALNEFESQRKCLSQYKEFIDENKLTNRNTLLLINEGLIKKENDIIKQLSTISNRISNFESFDLLKANKNYIFLLEDK